MPDRPMLGGVVNADSEDDVRRIRRSGRYGATFRRWVAARQTNP